MRIVFAAGCVLMLAGTAGAVTFTTDTLIAANDATYDDQDIIVEGCALTINGAHVFNSLIVQRNAANQPGVVTHSPAFSDAGVNGLALTIAGDVLVQGAEGDLVASRIDVDGKGYGPSSGPGKGGDGTTYPVLWTGGGGHGGMGSGSISVSGGLAYDSVLAPVEFGSGGGSSAYCQNGCSGGGAIRLTVAGTFTLDGSLTARGMSALVTSTYCGGGAGGSIYLTAGVLSGTGVIAVDGGNAGSAAGGGGGGGRIAIYCDSETFSGVKSAAGGSSPGGYNLPGSGGAGTVYVKLTSEAAGDLFVDNGGKAGAVTPLNEEGPYNRVVIIGQGNLDPQVLLDTVELHVGSEAQLSHAAEQTIQAVIRGNAVLEGGGSIQANLTMDVTGDMTVGNGCVITVEGKGYGPSSGPGRGGNTSNTCTGGGGHGGVGGGSGGVTGGLAHDSVTVPIEFGSGGGTGGYCQSGCWGGGAIRLTVAGVLTVDGSLSAQGTSASSTSTYCGGGAGGSIYLTAGVLSGTGVIAVDGGNAGSAAGGGGGGGRIAIYCDSDTFSGIKSAVGGNATAGTGIPGGAGTIYVKLGSEATGDLLIDNAGKAGALTPLTEAGIYRQLLLTGKGVLSPQVPLNTMELSVQEGASIQGNVSLTAQGDVIIGSGTLVSANEMGWGPASGPGAGSDGTAAGGGGGYGGRGGHFFDDLGGLAYGSITEPVDYGSGGGSSNAFGSGGAGGGLVRMIVGGTLTLDGTITANGGEGGYYGAGGGGSGGSIYLTVGTLAGAGSLSASGGSSQYRGGGGGGGRITIYCDSDSFSGSKLAAGGSAPALNPGGAGTIYVKLAGEAAGDLLIDNDGKAGEVTPLTADGAYRQVVIRGKADLDPHVLLDAMELHIASEGQLSHAADQTIQAVIRGNAVLEGGGSIRANLSLTAGGDVTITNGASVSANQMGGGAARGPGAGGDGSGRGAGGGYGGKGGEYMEALGGAAYGSITEPVDYGSGGGSSNAFGSGGAGGGLVRMAVSGTLTVDGVITVNGGDGGYYGSGGGGSGGSICLVVGTLNGAGLLSANGGNADKYSPSGGGGGGRVAVYCDTSTFSGTKSAAGGSGHKAGGAGTIYVKLAGQTTGDLLIDNAGTAGAVTPLTADGVYGQVLVMGKGILDPQVTLDAAELHISSGGQLSHAVEQTIQAVIRGNAVLESGGSIQANLSLVADGDVTVASDALVSANQMGWRPARGLGAGADGGGGGGGGGYGGKGGDCLGAYGAPGGPAYGSITEPVDYGSGGGSSNAFGSGGAGGGLVRMIVGGTLTLDGTITANGGEGGYYGAGGGGSGGSIYLTVGTLAGGGLLSANGGNPSEYSVSGGGGGGRIAIYFGSKSAFSGKLHVDAGGSGAQIGQVGTIWFHHNPPHVLSHRPSGVLAHGTEYVDVSFDQPIDESTFSPDDALLIDPDGARMPAASTRHIGGNVWRVSIPVQSIPGDYDEQIGPHIADLFGEELDQNGNRVSGEDPADAYHAGFTLMEVWDLPLESPVQGSFTASGQARCYRATVSAGKDLEITLNSADDAGANELYASFNTVPTRSQFEYYAAAQAQSNQVLRVRGTRSGTYYVLVYGTTVSDPTFSGFTITASYLPVSVTSVTPDNANRGHNGSAVHTIHGSSFDPLAAVVLHRDGRPDVPAVHATWIDAGTLMAQLNVYLQEAGEWTMRVTNPDGQVAEVPFTVLAGGPLDITAALILPSVLTARGGFSTLYVEYRYTGTMPMPVPLLKVHGAHNALLTADRTLAVESLQTWHASPFMGDTVQVLALGSDPDPAVLKPGDTGRISIYYRGVKPPWDWSPTMEFSLGILTADDETPIDWATMKDGMRPESMAADAWEAVFTNLTAQLGGTWGQYVARLGADAGYLYGLGEEVRDVPSLLAFEVLQAAGLSPHRTLAGAVDAYSPAPGMPLVFTRVYGQTIDSRYKLGPLGRGWSHNWDVWAQTLANQTVLIHGPNGLDRTFIDNGNGTYSAPPGEYGTLTRTGSFRLTEKDGTVWQFRPDDRLDYVEDTNSNRVTCIYTGTLLTGLTHSCGKSLTLTHNGDGRIVQLTDPAGRSTTYAYDGEHLVSVTAPGNRVTGYTYETGGTLPQLHALLSTAYPGGTHDYFTYDAAGRLTGTHRDNDAEPVTYSYNVGTVTVTDAAARQSTLYFGGKGQLVKAQDAQGHAIALRYDQNGNLIGLLGPQAQQYDQRRNPRRLLGQQVQQYNYSYDQRGNVLGVQDPLDNVTAFAYTPGLNRLASFTDARGNGVRYAYDTSGNVMSITYQDNSIERFTYDAQGNVLTWTNRRGQTVTCTYNAAGQVTSKDYSTTPGVMDYTFAYDSASRLITVTGPEGTTTLTYTPGANSLMRIEYPGDRFFALDYDTAGRRAKRTDQDGSELRYAYDGLGRLARLSDENDALIVEYGYDAAGRLSLKTLGNGVYTTYAYDTMGHLVTVVNHTPDGGVLSRFDYTYDENGRVASTTTSGGTFSYSYDLLGQLTRVVDPDECEVTYEYDAVGNRTSVDNCGSSAAYATNPMNQYTAVGDGGYQYDADGNMISRTSNGQTAAYVFDIENRLVGIITPTDVWSFIYDAFGNLIGIIHNGVKTELVVDPLTGQVAAEYQEGALAASYYQGHGLVGRRGTTNIKQYYTFDGTWNTTEVTNAAGVVINYYDHDPFGLKKLVTETVPNMFQYLGEKGSIAVGQGLHFVKTQAAPVGGIDVLIWGPVGLGTSLSRTYSPDIGRFVSAGPVGLGANLYEFWRNNPLAAEGIMPFVEGAAELAKETITHLRNGKVSPFGTLVTGALGALGFLEHYQEMLKSLEHGDSIQGWRHGGHAGLGGIAVITSVFGVTGPVGWVLGGAFILAGVSDYCGDHPDVCGNVGKWAWSQILDNWTPMHFFAKLATRLVAAFDPNEKLGPGGFGDQGFVTPDKPLPYTVYFENDKSATAAARRVDIADPLNANLDANTFELGEILFGSRSVAVPSGLKHYETTVPIDGWTWNETQGWHTGETPLMVKIVADIDAGTGLATWTIGCYDPNTGLPPEDAYAGFLPPNDPPGEGHTGRGEGHVGYVIRAKAGLPSGTEIRNVAQIQFDGGEIIATNQIDPHDPSKGTDPAKEALITIDAGTPASWVKPLPQATAAYPLRVEWEGQDEAGGSGIASYDVYLSVDGGPWALWQTTAETSAPLNGQPGHAYAFYTVATDNVGHREEPPANADAATGTPIQAPGAPSLGEITATTIVLADLGTANMGSVEHVLFEQVTGKFVDADGRLSAEPVWRSLDAWAGTRVWGGLTPATEYRFQTKARAADTETEFGPAVTVITSRRGDASGDGIASGTDIAIVAAALGSTPGQLTWDPRADLNGDGRVDAQDRKLIQLARVDPDGDNDVDQVDFGHFQACYTGPAAEAIQGGCADTDFDGDEDVDKDDLVAFKSCFSGPAIPVNQGCVD
ncbi:MAG TPA: DUF6531 domain-containing protein [Phycisphaerae bacterium]|nr:DUF6531 domain-containing protein [Phycisphaerae bacterium]HRY71396.1 DUF6531 domain-containing protein [Phycisphaerae bacterium]HSA29879.1 DUF6531 domain-containing protein [Phycisphaerae bacterium]